MKHLCNCGEIVEADGKSLLIATCPNCGMYYIYADEIVHPHNDRLLKDIQSKVHPTHAIVVEEDARPFIAEELKDIPCDMTEPVKVKPRAAKRR